MNNYAYPFFPINNNQSIIEELIKMNETLKKIELKLDKLEQSNNKNNYLEKEDNYYML